MRQENRSVILSSKVTFRLDNKHLNFLERYAVAEGISVSMIVRHLVCRFIENQRVSIDVPVPVFRLGGRL